MPSDASIYSMIRTPTLPSPLQTAAQAMQIRGLMTQNQAQGLQLDEQQKLRDVFANNPNPSVGDVMAASPTAGMNYQKFQLEKQLNTAKLDETQQKVLAAKALDARNSLAGVTDQNSYDQWRQYAASKGYQVGLNAPSQYDPAWQKQHLYTADTFLAQLNQKGIPVDTGGSIQLRNPQTGEPIGKPIPKTMSPEAAATLPFTRGNFQINRARAAYEGVPGLDGIGNPAAPSGAAPAGAPSQSGTVAPASGAPASPAAPVNVSSVAKSPLVNDPSLTPKARADLASKLVQEKPRDLTALEDNEATLDQAISTAKQVLNHPGMYMGTGALGEVAGRVPGSNAYDFRQALQTLKGQVMLGVLQKLKSVSPTGSSGFGQLSNAEGDTLRNSITNLEAAQSEGQLKSALDKVISTMQGSKERLTRGYERIYGEQPQIKSYAKSQQGSAPPGGLTQDDIDAELRRRGVIK